MYQTKKNSKNNLVKKNIVSGAWVWSFSGLCHVTLSGVVVVRVTDLCTAAEKKWPTYKMTVNMTVCSPRLSTCMAEV